MSDTVYSNEVYNIGGMTNLIEDDGIVDWYKGIEGCLNPVEPESIYPSEGILTVLHEGVKDLEFLSNRPDATGFHYSYNITEYQPVDGMVRYNAQIQKNDIKPYIPN